MSIPGASSPLLLASAATAEDPYAISRSLRFNSGDSAYLSRTPSSAGNRKKFTWSGWVKRSKLGVQQRLFGNYNSSGLNGADIQFTSSDNLKILDYTSSTQWQLITTAVYRDPSSWYHVVVALDTTQSTNSDRLKLYVNGAQVTAFSTSTYPGSNVDGQLNTAQEHGIGRAGAYNQNYFDGYLADVQFLDGIAASASDFGETDSDGVWQAKQYQGSYNLAGSSYSTAGSFSASGQEIGGIANAYDGNNGSNGGSTSGVTFWGRAAGTATHSGFSISVSNTVAVRVYYNVNTGGGSISVNGVSKSAGVPGGGNTTIGVLEWSATELSNAFTSIAITSPNGGVGVYVCGIEADGTLLSDVVGGVNGFHLKLADNSTDAALGTDSSGNSNTWTVNNLTAVAGETEANKSFDVVTYSGTGSDQAISGLSFQPDFVWIKTRNEAENHFIVDSVRGVAEQLYANLTSAEYTNSNRFKSFNSDGFTVGTTDDTNQSGNSFVAWAWNAGANSNKTYTVKVVSDSGNKYRFDDFGTSAVTLDLAEGSTYVFDQSDSSNSGHPLRFSTTSNGTHGGGSEYTTGVTTTGTPGSAGAKTTIVVASGAPTLYYYCTQHSGMGGQANTNSTAGASNFDGSVQATVKASAAYGFSVITATQAAQSGLGCSVGHGLSTAPAMYIVKDRDAGTAWGVYHQGLGSASKALQLNTTSGQVTTSGYFNDTAPTSSVLTVGSGVGLESDDFVCYAWSEIAGFSKFGSYTGSSSAQTITTGFKPAFVILKDTTQAANWVVLDSKRGSSWLEADGTAAENSNSNQQITFNADGFTVSGDKFNVDGKLSIYMAFAANFTNPECDSLVDTPEQRADQTDTGAGGEVVGNYCTWNAVNNNLILSNGNLEAVSTSTVWRSVTGTIAMTSGKWYWEVTATTVQHNVIGVARADAILPVVNSQEGWDGSPDGYLYYSFNGKKYHNGTSTSYGASYTAGDVVGIAWDADAGNLVFYKNGVSQGTAYSGLTGGPFVPAVSLYNTSSSVSANFGARPWAYPNSVPSGYKALNTANLPTATIADGSQYFDAKLYTGDNTAARSVSSYNFSPDFVWAKSRSGTYYHGLFDVLRSGYALYSNAVSAEDTTEQIGFASNGFTTPNKTGDFINANNASYVAWAWDAGSSNTSIAVGGLNSSVYDQSQTWSSYITGTVDSSYGSATDLFNGTVNTGTSNGTRSTNPGTLTLDLSSLNITAQTVTLYTYIYGTPSNFKVNGVAVDQSTASGNGDRTFTVTVGGQLNTIAWSYDSGSGPYCYMNGIEIDGKLLVNSGVTPTNVPTIASTTRANPSAGFSIVSYTVGSNVAQTVGHGLNAPPEMIIVKERNQSSTNWYVYHSAIGSDNYLTLNSSNGSNPNNLWDNTDPTSSVFTVRSGGSSNFYDGKNQIAYCFSSVDGYSSVGSFTGNGSSDGPFVFTGHRSRWIMIKRTDASYGWYMYDTARDPDNVVGQELLANDNGAEVSDSDLDILSNGFKPRRSSLAFNSSGGNFIYISFAENPFSLARAR